MREIVRAVDRRMRLRQGITEFTDDADCILRISFAAADRALRLADGVVVKAGDPILEMHFWNERLPQARGPTGLGWGGRFSRRVRRSLAHLAVALDRDPRLAGVVALRARLAFAGVRDSADSRRFGAWFGFELAETTRAATPRQRVRAIIDDLWLLALTYTFNPGALRRRALVRRHDDMWISRAALIARYGAETKGSG